MTPEQTVIALAVSMDYAAKEGRVLPVPGWPNPCSQGEPAPQRTLTEDDVDRALTRTSRRRAWLGDPHAPTLAVITLRRAMQIADIHRYNFAETIDFLDEVVDIPPGKHHAA